MTRTESKLRKAGLGNKIDNGQITIKSGNKIEIYVADADIGGFKDFEATDEIMDKAIEVLGWGGYECGHGAMVLQKDYVKHAADAGR